MKNKYPLNLTVTIVLMCFALSSCSDDDTYSKTTLLTSHQWNVNTIEAADQITKAAAELLYKGSSYRFDNNGTYEGELGTTFSNLKVSGTWEFNRDDTKLTLDKGKTEEQIFEVLSLTVDQLSLKTETGITLIYKK